MPNRVKNAEDKAFSELYWRGHADAVAWDDLRKIVDDGFWFRKKRNECDVALFPAISDLVVLDCDVKTYDKETGHVVPGFTLNPNGSYSPAPKVIKRGIDDLTREVEKLGHSMSELATYVVETKSGGFHLYFRANPTLKLHTDGHHKDWRVDVVAHNDKSDRSWVAAPPTVGYTVVRDYPLAEMPFWLALFLKEEVSTWERPRGGTRKQAEHRRRSLQLDYERASTSDERHGLYNAWIMHELDEVRLANKFGGWNDAINICAWVLFKEAELSWDDGKRLILQAADPWSDVEKRKALDTLQSAFRAARPGDDSYLEE